MSPLAAFPIMMGSCALLMPWCSIRFVRTSAYDPKASFGLTALGIVGVLIAAFIVKSLPLDVLRWVVVVVILYTSIVMFRSIRKKDGPTTPAEACETKIERSTGNQSSGRTARLNRASIFAPGDADEAEARLEILEDESRLVRLRRSSNRDRGSPGVRESASRAASAEGYSTTNLDDLLPAASAYSARAPKILPSWRKMSPSPNVKIRLKRDGPADEALGAGDLLFRRQERRRGAGPGAHRAICPRTVFASAIIAGTASSSFGKLFTWRKYRPLRIVNWAVSLEFRGGIPAKRRFLAAFHEIDPESRFGTRHFIDLDRDLGRAPHIVLDDDALEPELEEKVGTPVDVVEQVGLDEDGRLSRRASSPGRNRLPEGRSRAAASDRGSQHEDRGAERERVSSLSTRRSTLILSGAIRPRPSFSA